MAGAPSNIDRASSIMASAPSNIDRASSNMAALLRTWPAFLRTSTALLRTWPAFLRTGLTLVRRWPAASDKRIALVHNATALRCLLPGYLEKTRRGFPCSSRPFGCTNGGVRGRPRGYSACQRKIDLVRRPFMSGRAHAWMRRRDQRRRRRPFTNSAGVFTCNERVGERARRSVD